MQHGCILYALFPCLLRRLNYCHFLLVFMILVATCHWQDVKVVRKSLHLNVVEAQSNGFSIAWINGA